MIDEDGSGAIGIEELADPLLTSDTITNKAQLKRLLTTLDVDGSGEVDFEEFIAAFQPRAAGEKQSSAKHIGANSGLGIRKLLRTSSGSTLSRNATAVDMNLSTTLSAERRQFLMYYLTEFIPATAKAHVWSFNGNTNGTKNHRPRQQKASEKEVHEKFYALKQLVLT